MNILRELLLNNIGLKAVSLLLAFLMWVQIAGRQTVQTTVSVPVEFINIPAELEISNSYQKQVDVVIRSELGRPPGQRSMVAVVDLRKATPGTMVVPLAEDSIRNKPQRVEIISITPPNIKLQLERTAVKIVKVQTETVGRPAQGFEVTAIQVVPSEVLVTGPESRLQKVSTAQTEPITIEGGTSEITQSVHVYLEDPRLRIQNPKPVTVTVSIEERRRKVQLRQVRVSLRPEGTAAQLLTRRVDVTGTMPASFHGELKASDFVALVDVQGLRPNPEPYEIIPRIVPPENYASAFRTESVIPWRVRVKVK